MEVKPRIGRNGDLTGRYELVARVHNSISQPGGTIYIEIFISGYGRIDNSKLAFYPPIDNLLLETSQVSGGLKKDKDTGILTWSGDPQTISNTGFVLQLNNIKNLKNQDVTTFFDARYAGIENDGVPRLVTESALGVNTQKGLPSEFQAPIVLRLDITKKAKPGTYYTSIVFTYFNGESWQISSIQPSFTLRTLFQRNEGCIAVLGIIAALGSGSGLIPYIKGLYYWIISCLK